MVCHASSHVNTQQLSERSNSLPSNPLFHSATPAFRSHGPLYRISARRRALLTSAAVASSGDPFLNLPRIAAAASSQPPLGGPSSAATVPPGRSAPVVNGGAQVTSNRSSVGRGTQGSSGLAFLEVRARFQPAPHGGPAAAAPVAAAARRPGGGMSAGEKPLRGGLRSEKTQPGDAQPPRPTSSPAGASSVPYTAGGPHVSPPAAAQSSAPERAVTAAPDAGTVGKAPPLAAHHQHQAATGSPSPPCAVAPGRKPSNPPSRPPHSRRRGPPASPSPSFFTTSTTIRISSRLPPPQGSPGCLPGRRPPAPPKLLSGALLTAAITRSPSLDRLVRLLERHGALGDGGAMGYTAVGRGVPVGVKGSHGAVAAAAGRKGTAVTTASTSTAGAGGIPAAPLNAIQLCAAMATAERLASRGESTDVTSTSTSTSTPAPDATAADRAPGGADATTDPARTRYGSSRRSLGASLDRRRLGLLAPPCQPLTRRESNVLTALLETHREVLADADPPAMAAILWAAARLRLRPPPAALEPALEAMWLWDPADPIVNRHGPTATRDDGGERGMKEVEDSGTGEEEEDEGGVMGPQEVCLLLYAVSVLWPEYLRRQAGGFLEALNSYETAPEAAAAPVMRPGRAGPARLRLRIAGAGGFGAGRALGSSGAVRNRDQVTWLTPEQVVGVVAALARADVRLDEEGEEFLLQAVVVRLPAFTLPQLTALLSAAQSWAPLGRLMHQQLMGAMLHRLDREHRGQQLLRQIARQQQQQQQQLQQAETRLARERGLTAAAAQTHHGQKGSGASTVSDLEGIRQQAGAPRSPYTDLEGIRQQAGAQPSSASGDGTAGAGAAPSLRQGRPTHPAPEVRGLAPDAVVARALVSALQSCQHPRSSAGGSSENSRSYGSGGGAHSAAAGGLRVHGSVISALLRQLRHRAASLNARDVCEVLRLMVALEPEKARVAAWNEGLGALVRRWRDLSQELLEELEGRRESVHSPAHLALASVARTFAASLHALSKLDVLLRPQEAATAAAAAAALAPYMATLADCCMALTAMAAGTLGQEDPRVGPGPDGRYRGGSGGAAGGTLMWQRLRRSTARGGDGVCPANTRLGVIGHRAARAVLEQAAVHLLQWVLSSSSSSSGGGGGSGFAAAMPPVTGPHIRATGGFKAVGGRRGGGPAVVPAAFRPPGPGELACLVRAVGALGVMPPGDWWAVWEACARVAVPPGASLPPLASGGEKENHTPPQRTQSAPSTAGALPAQVLYAAASAHTNVLATAATTPGPAFSAAEAVDMLYSFARLAHWQNRRRRRRLTWRVPKPESGAEAPKGRSVKEGRSAARSRRWVTATSPQMALAPSDTACDVRSTHKQSVPQLPQSQPKPTATAPTVPVGRDLLLQLLAVACLSQRPGAAATPRPDDRTTFVRRYDAFRGSAGAAGAGQRWSPRREPGPMSTFFLAWALGRLQLTAPGEAALWAGRLEATAPAALPLLTPRKQVLLMRSLVQLYGDAGLPLPPGVAAAWWTSFGAAMGRAGGATLSYAAAVTASTRLVPPPGWIAALGTALGTRVSDLRVREVVALVSALGLLRLRQPQPATAAAAAGKQLMYGAPRSPYTRPRGSVRVEDGGHRRLASALVKVLRHLLTASAKAAAAAAATSSDTPSTARAPAAPASSTPTAAAAASTPRYSPGSGEPAAGTRPSPILTRHEQLLARRLCVLLAQVATASTAAAAAAAGGSGRADGNGGVAPIVAPFVARPSPGPSLGQHAEAAASVAGVLLDSAEAAARQGEWEGKAHGGCEAAAADGDDGVSLTPAAPRPVVVTLTPRPRPPSG